MSVQSVNLPLSELALNSSEATAPAGSLAVSSALLPEQAHSGLQPVFPYQPATTPAGGTLSVPEGCRLAFLHTTAIYTNKIIFCSAQNGSYYVARLHDDGTTTTLLSGLADEPGVTAIGNTLLVATPTEIHYLLFRPTAGTYTDLGTHLPSLPLSFALSSEFVMQYFQNTGITIKNRPNTTNAAGRVIIDSLLFCALTPQSFEQVSLLGTTQTVRSFAFNDAATLDFAHNTYALRFKTKFHTYNNFIVITGVPQSAPATRVPIYLFGGSRILKTVTLATTNGNEFLGSTSEVYSQLHLCIGDVAAGTDPDNTNLINDKAEHTAFLLRSEGSYTPQYIDQSTSDALNAVLGSCARFVTDQATSRNRFAFPFFLRYGLRLFDGSIFPLSDPVLLLPITGPSPHVYYTPSDTVTLYVAGVISQLLYRLHPEAAHALNALRTDWRDVVTGIVFAVSDPVYTYNQGAEWQPDKELLSVNLIAETNGNAKTFYDNDAGFSVSRFPGITGCSAFASYDYSSQLFRTGYGNDFTGNKLYEITLPTFTDEQLRDNLLSVSAFHVCAEMPLSDLTVSSDVSSDVMQGFTALPIKEGTLSTITTREAVPDAYLSRTTLGATSLYAYSSRLNLSGITETLAPACALPMLSGYESGGFSTFLQIIVRADTTDGYRYAFAQPFSTDLGIGARFFFYPDARAVEALCFARVQSTASLSSMAIVAPRAVLMAARLNLTRHDFLQGAYWFNDFTPVSFSPDDFTLGWTDLSSSFASPLSPQAVYDALTSEIKAPSTVTHAAEVFTSSVDNPWLFPAVSRSAVGSGRVLAIVANATALTQEQYGSHPLYAFCTDGIWALAQNSEGEFVQVQHVSRNVLLSPSAICQLDTAIAYATNRGIYVLSGLRSECISEKLLSASSAQLAYLPGFAIDGPFHSPAINLPRFLSEASIAYDYRQNRLIVFSFDYDFSLIYSFRTAAWATAPFSFSYSVNAFPDAFLQGHAMSASALSVFSLMAGPATTGTDGQSTQPVVLATRPFLLSDVSRLVTPRQVIVRGDFEPKRLSIALYGARTLSSNNWYLLGSVKNCNALHFHTGSPYRYFRLALCANLLPQESIAEASISFSQRDTNQLR